MLDETTILKVGLIIALAVTFHNYLFLVRHMGSRDPRWFVPDWTWRFWHWLRRTPIDINGGDGGDLELSVGLGGKGDKEKGGEDGLPGRFFLRGPGGVVLAKVEGDTVYLRNDLKVEHVPFIEPPEVRKFRARPAPVSRPAWRLKDVALGLRRPKKKSNRFPRVTFDPKKRKKA